MTRSTKASDLDPLFASLKVADLLERVANDAEREQGLDLADYLLSRGASDTEATKANGPPVWHAQVGSDVPPGLS